MGGEVGGPGEKAKNFRPYFRKGGACGNLRPGNAVNMGEIKSFAWWADQGVEVLRHCAALNLGKSDGARAVALIVGCFKVHNHAGRVAGKGVHGVFP